MYKDKILLGIIPARGGSKRLPRKNLLPFAGKPLLAWTIEAAQASRTLDRVVVNTEDNEIKEVSKQYNVEVVLRPEALATDTATTFDVLIHTLDTLKADGYEPDVIVLLQPTSPLRESADIDKAVECWQRYRDATVIGVCELGNPAAAWSFVMDKDALTPVLGWDILTKRSQDVPKLYIPNGAIYVFTPAVLRARGRVLGPPLIPYIMPIERSIDIDTQEEFHLAKKSITQSKI